MMKHYLWIGLGNPGAEFENTRHNTGINALRQWAAAQKDPAVWRTEDTWPAALAHLMFPNATVTVFFPLTFMNDSGAAVKKFLAKNPDEDWQILIIHDDLETPLGEVALVSSGGARGHNGVRSIQAALGTTDVPRLMIGIGRPQEYAEIKDFVLQPLPSEENVKLEPAFARAQTLLSGLIGL